MSGIVLAKYQERLIAGIAEEISCERPKACVLTAPTGSGKTLIIGHALTRAAEASPIETAWFWFAPFGVIVGQTSDALRTDGGGVLRPRDLAVDRHESLVQKNDVWLSTSAYLASSKSGLRQDSDYAPSLETLVAAMRRRGLRIGLVIDEAHIGPDEGTKIGETCAIIKPDVVVAATATPNDTKLGRFLSKLGMVRRDFSVERREVVRERLNKSSLRILRLVADASASTYDPESLKDLLVERAIARNAKIADTLRRNGVNIVPLLLVQVGDGDDEGQVMKRRLMDKGGFSSDEIAVYLDTEKTHDRLTEIAHDPRIRALVFKLAAGTGFDAPRAFVLASSRRVADQDHAMQFIGRIMRVQREVRALLLGRQLNEEDRKILDTGRLVVLDDKSQAGFRSAADIMKKLAGIDPKVGIDPEVQSVEIEDEDLDVDEGKTTQAWSPTATLPAGVQTTTQPGNADTAVTAWTAMESDGGTKNSPMPIVPRSGIKARQLVLGPRVEGYTDLEDLCSHLESIGIQLWQRGSSIDGLPDRFAVEEWPGIDEQANIATRLAAAHQIQANDVVALRDRALGKVRIQMVEAELMSSAPTTQEGVDLDNRRTATREAERRCEKALDRLESLADPEQRRMLVSIVARDTMNTGVIESKDRALAQTIAKFFIAENINHFLREEASGMMKMAVRDLGDPLPDAIVLPMGCGDFSAKSIYGFTPPSKTEWDKVDLDIKLILKLWQDKTIRFATGKELTIRTIDNDWVINATEKEMISILESQDHVVWWMRNPAGKKFAVKLLKIDEQRGHFFPDFVIGTRWDENLRQQLAETKYDEIDLQAKLRRGPTIDYGRVIFIALREGKMRLVNNDGTLGDAVSIENTGGLTRHMRLAINA